MYRFLILALFLLAACAPLAPDHMLGEPVTAEPAVMDGAEPAPAEAIADTELRSEICENAISGDGIGGTGCPMVD